MIGIRRMRPADAPRVVALWRKTRPHDHVDQKKLEAFLASSPFSIPEATLVAADGDEIIGAIVGTIRGEHEGRIPLFFLSPEHVDSRWADALLHGVFQVFTNAGISRAEAGTSWETGLSDCGYDTRYKDIIGVLSRNGFHQVWSDEDLDVDIRKDLRTLAVPQWVADARDRLRRETFSFGLCTPSLQESYLAFMLEHFGTYGGWCTRAKEYVERSRESGFHMLAFHNRHIVGFTECVFDVGDGDWHIYATGVRTDLRRKKIGSVLVYESLAEMKKRGAARMYIGDAPLDFYRIVEGTVLRRYMVMRRDLGTTGTPAEATQ